MWAYVKFPFNYKHGIWLKLTKEKYPCPKKGKMSGGMSRGLLGDFLWG